MLRIGIIIDSNIAPAWVAEIMQEISQSPTIKIVMVAQHETSHKINAPWPYPLFKKIDQALWPAQHDLVTEIPVPMPQHVPLITLKASAIDNKIFYDDHELIKVTRFQPDLLLYFGSAMLSGKILKLPTHGVWSLYFGGTHPNTHIPPGFWEWFHETLDTSVTLQQIMEEPEEVKIIAKTITRTIYVSHSRNAFAILSKGMDLVVESVNKLAEAGNYRTVNEETRNSSLAKKSAHTIVYRAPGLVDSLRAIQRLITRAIPRAISKILFLEPWVLFFTISDDEHPSLNFKTFKPLIPPKDRIWADPFVISQDDKHYLFIEEMFVKTNKGHLTCLVLDKMGNIETSDVILEKPYHLSYPFIFTHEGTWYMIPESTENKTVDLYECIGFPLQWKFKRTLLANVHAVDSTLHVSEGKFWLFCAIQNRPGSSPNDDLHIFYTDDLLDGTWKPHQQNPVISDPYNARPAGRIFQYNGAWCRPSQICIPDYGYGLALNRIVELNERSYKEERIMAELPHWRKNLLAMHTLNFSSKITFIDGILKRSRF
ncbi:MAG: hypothetical protein RI909_1802 [Bacteroidota bacterium]